jgi:excinuclease ABC subunit C
MKVDDIELLEKFLQARYCRKVSVDQAVSKDDKAVLRLIERNLDVITAERSISRQAGDTEKGLDELAAALGLNGPPGGIECFDISNIQGTHAVASMVRFQDGLPDKSRYRRYRIRGYEKADDPGMIHEAVGRRLQHFLNENDDPPELIVIDGGRTQLTRAREAAAALGVDIPIVSLAKKFEEIYLEPGKPPLRLPGDSMALKILTRIRDEAHRFAVAYHRNLRDRKGVQSLLDAVPGVGEARRRILFKHFKSVENLRNAGIEEISEVPGIGKETARAVHDFFHGNG